MKNAKIMVIMNSSAGRGYHLPSFTRKMLRLSLKENISLDETHRRIKAGLEACGQSPDIVWTEHAGHATELAAQAAEEGYGAVVAVGGDGTVNEVVNGVVNSSTALGVVPVGTANLFAAEMGIPANIEAACRVIAKGDVRAIDTGSVNDRSFTLMAGIGFDAHVVSKVNSKIKNRWGALSYPLVAIRELIRYPFRRIEIRTEEGVELQAFYVIVQNARSYASGFTLTDSAKIDDGSLEVLIFPSKNIVKFILCNFSKNKYKYCTKMRGVKFLEVNSPHAIQIDGDYMCKGPATIKVAPHSLRVLTGGRKD
jgi:diacylglycerol kinase (ATP)